MERFTILQAIVASCSLILSVIAPQLVHASAAFCTGVGVSLPGLVTAYSPPIAPAAVGEEFVIAATVTNICLAEEDQKFLGILEARSSNGTTQFFGWQSATLDRSTLEANEDIRAGNMDNWGLHPMGLSTTGF